MSKIRFLSAATAAVALFAAIGLAQIRSANLSEMLTELNANAVYGEITASKVIRLDDPAGENPDGPELFFTTITIEGRTVGDATPLTIDVTFAGGFINETEGVYNSEAPAAEAVKIGKRVVAFHKWQDNIGGGLAANALVCGHGGVFQTADGPKGTVVLGRGQGFAIPQNLKVGELDSAVTKIRKQERR